MYPSGFHWAKGNVVAPSLGYFFVRGELRVGISMTLERKGWDEVHFQLKEEYLTLT